MISPWSLFKESISLFLKNFKYLLKFWLVKLLIQYPPLILVVIIAMISVAPIYSRAFNLSVVVAENLSGTAALKRSKQLVKGRFWKTVWYLVFPTIIVVAYSFITSAVSVAIPKPSRAVFEVLFSIVTWPFGLVSLIYSFLVYREFAK